MPNILWSLFVMKIRVTKNYGTNLLIIVNIAKYFIILDKEFKVKIYIKFI